MNNLMILNYDNDSDVFSPTGKMAEADFKALVNVSVGHDKGCDLLFELTKSRRSQRGSSELPFIVELRINMQPKIPHMRDGAVLPPRLQILSPKTAASLLPTDI